MLRDYKKGSVDESFEFKGVINWRNVTSVTLSKEKVTTHLELEEISNKKKQPKFPAGGKYKWSESIEGLFPKRNISVESKEVYTLKVDGVIVVMSDDLNMISNDYEFFKNEWETHMNSL